MCIADACFLEVFMKLHNPFRKLTRSGWIIWSVSVVLVTLSFVLGSEFEPLTLAASLIGVTALIFLAGGDVWGQILTIVFSLFYSFISLKFHYYGEMITYLGMTAPIAALSVVSWLKHPYRKEENEVEVAKLTAVKAIVLLVLTAIVTALFYFILEFFGTANLLVSTISIATSFLASALMFLRSKAYALAYAANDIVLIVLWVLASLEEPSYFPMIICFSAFLVNDLYGFYSWNKMHKRQRIDSETAAVREE